MQGWTVDDSTFGARLALVRQRMQWNIKEAARECGIPPASWGTWEGGAMPRRYLEMCRMISDRVGCDYLWLVDGPRLAGGETGSQTTARYLPVAIRIDQPPRPRDNRPTGRPTGGAAAGPGRTTYVARSVKRERS